MTGLLITVYSLTWLAWVPWPAWIVLGWIVLALAVGLLVGRMIRNRDRQVPTALSDRPLRRDDQGGAL